MRKIFLLLACLLTLSATTPSLAEALRETPRTQALSLYASPNLKAKVLKQLNTSTQFIPVFKKGIWLKVGIPTDGTVGWINRDEYQQSLQAQYQPSTQSITVRTERDTNGKETVHITAYRNGKKLSDEEASALYQKMRKQPNTNWSNANNQRLIKRMIQRQIELMNDLLYSGSLDSGEWPMVQPIILINTSDKQNAKK